VPEKSEPVKLQTGPHLFVDDYLIADESNLRRTINRPTRLPMPLVTGKEDGNYQPYFTVLRDANTRRFRMWYGVPIGPDAESDSHLAYMESENGIDWIRPHRVLDDPAPIKYGASVIDDGPAYPDPSRRFKFAWWCDGGLQVAASPDGLMWKPLAPGVVLPHNHDINCIFRDTPRNRYIALVSVGMEGEGWTGKRRIPHQSASQDLIRWENPWPVLTPDEEDEGETQFYCMSGLTTRGDLLIGMARVLRDDLSAEPGGQTAGIGYTALAWNRDGEHWERDREPFLNRGETPGDWDRAMAWIDCQLPVGDEIYLYYAGYARGHKIERKTERQIGLARMPRDRFVSRDAGQVEGRLCTRPIILESTQLTLNADASGRILVRFLDAHGRPFPGFDWEDCAEITGDSLLHPVKWKSDPASLMGKPVTMEFAMRDARLYGFDLRE